MLVVETCPDIKLPHTNPLNETGIVGPVIIDDRRIVRTVSKLYCPSGDEANQ